MPRTPPFTPRFWSCRRRPDAALFASNLGSLLDGIGDPRAAQVLAYAVALAPGTVLPRVNLGWLQFHRGDLAAAKASFRAAGRTAPRSGVVLLGQGMVAYCEGDHRLAAELLSRALSHVSSRAAEQALDDSQTHQSEAPPGTPEAVAIPRRDDWTRNARPGRILIAEPIVLDSNEAAIKQGLARNEAIVQGYDDRTKQLLSRQQGLNPNAGGNRVPVRTATSVTLFRSDDAMVALARAQFTAYAARIRAVRAPFERAFEDQKERVSSRVQAIMAEAQTHGERVLAVYCSAAKAAMEQEYSRFRTSWRGTWEAEQKVIREYGETAGATISQIRHDDLRRYVDIERQLHVVTWALDGPADVIGWGPLGGAIMPCGEATPPAPKSAVDPSDDAAKAPCPPFLQDGFGFDCGIASVSLDCEKIGFSGRRGNHRPLRAQLREARADLLPGGRDRRDRGRRSVERRRGGIGGAFVTTGAGEVRDVGYSGSAGAAAGPFSMEAGVTVGVVSGPSTSSSATFNAGPASFGIP